MSDPTQSTRKLGSGMLALAWLMVIGLLMVFFQDMLDEQRNPNQQLSSAINGGYTEVRLLPNRQHHYVLTGQINDHPVTFLLDTGATDVAIPEKLANRIGLRKGASHQVFTANGTAIAYRTQIDQLKIGDIQLSNINASITTGMPGDIILLGMSALRELEFSQKGDALILRQAIR
jgi:aspartyl protease family protein